MKLHRYPDTESHSIRTLFLAVVVTYTATIRRRVDNHGFHSDATRRHTVHRVSESNIVNVNNTKRFLFKNLKNWPNNRNFRLITRYFIISKPWYDSIWFHTFQFFIFQKFILSFVIFQRFQTFCNEFAERIKVRRNKHYFYIAYPRPFTPPNGKGGYTACVYKLQCLQRCSLFDSLQSIF